MRAVERGSNHREDEYKKLMLKVDLILMPMLMISERDGGRS